MSKISYRGYRFPPEIIQRAVWLYFRFTLSFRDVEDLLAERGIEVSYETIRRWATRFGPAIARKRAAKKLMRKFLKKQGFVPNHLITDHRRSYPAAFQEMGLTAVHHRGKRMNNRAESSHVPIRRRKRKMQGLKSAKSAQRFLSAHGPIYNTFNTCRHLISAANHRRFRREAMAMWRQAACIAA